MSSSSGGCQSVEIFDLGAPKTPPWVTGFADSAIGPIPAVPAHFSRSERSGRLKCRLFNSFRMNYTVDPGIYAVGSPDRGSVVLVTANYKLSFDLLRKELPGINAWILVLNTRGINVWCAAGKGTFGTAELIKRVQATRLSEIVSHRSIILPQLGAPGVQAHRVKQETGFTVSYGPVYARDLPEYLRSGRKAAAKMREVRFGLGERIELTPMEIVPALKGFLIFAAGVFVIFGLQPQGILFHSVLFSGVPVLALGASALLSGTVLTPVLLPWIPFRAFALKGFLLSVVTTALLVLFIPVEAFRKAYLVAFCLLFFPAAGSYLALQFTGSTVFTSISGVKKELKVSLPLYITAAAASFIFLILYKLREWGIGI